MIGLRVVGFELLGFRIVVRTGGFICGLVCGRTCGLVCGRTCGLVCGRTCGLACGRTCGLVCGRTCGLVCGRTCGLCASITVDPKTRKRVNTHCPHGNFGLLAVELSQFAVELSQ
ncbi:MAG: hypothetical protein P8K66_06620 [Planctomycetota bacterium]|nr:hypothetical protein [Planctomycetota bacterium]